MINRHKKKLQWALLAFVVSALVIYAVYSQLISVVPVNNRRYDPEMAYFMNSLGILDGYPYYYADHPGTPVNLAGTLIFAVMSPLAMLGGQSDFTAEMLLHPGRFLLVARLLVSALNIVAVIYIWRFSKDKVSLAGLVLILTSYFVVLSADYWSVTVFWSHNAFCLSLGTVFLFASYQVLSSPGRRTYRRLAWLGAGAGFLLAVQLYFSAWVIGILAVVYALLWIEKRHWRIIVRQISAVVGGVIAAFLIVNLPVIHRFVYLINWVRGIVKHLGRYGRGDAGVISLPVMWDNFIAYQQDGFILLFGLAVLLLFGLAVLALRRRNFTDQKVLWAFAGGVGLQTLFVCLLILKHPGTEYLMAVAAVIPVLLFVWFNLHQTESQFWARLYVAAACLFLVGFTWQFVDALLQHDQAGDFQEAQIALVENYLTDYAAQHDQTKDDLRIFFGYRAVVDWCEPLRFGNFWANNIYSDLINQQCLHENQWDVWQNVFLIDDMYVRFEDYDDWDVIILQSDYWDAVEFFADKAVTIQRIDHVLTFVTPG